MPSCHFLSSQERSGSWFQNWMGLCDVNLKGPSLANSLSVGSFLLVSSLSCSHCTSASWVARLPRKGPCVSAGSTPSAGSGLGEPVFIHLSSGARVLPGHLSTPLPCDPGTPQTILCFTSSASRPPSPAPTSVLTQSRDPLDGCQASDWSNKPHIRSGRACALTPEEALGEVGGARAPKRVRASLSLEPRASSD